MARTLSEKIEQFMNENNISHLEGERGLDGLCQLVHAIGYEDPMFRYQLSKDACLGDLIKFFEDNPGAIEAVVNWIGKQDVSEWGDTIEEYISDEEEEED